MSQAVTGECPQILSVQVPKFLIHLRSLWKYARYFAKRHPKVTEDEKAVEIVVRLEENTAVAQEPGLGRRMTVRTIDATSVDENEPILSVLSQDQSSHHEQGTLTRRVTSGMDTPTRIEERIEAIDYFSHGQGLATINGSQRSSRSDDAGDSLGPRTSVTGLV
jgi:hypothetical protein